MVPRAGQRIGPYEILGRLGSGGMGLVFSAWDERLQRDVAIKLLRDEYCTPEMRSRFLQEARAASGLNHPNICTIFDIGEQKGDPYLVMELLRGETLRTRIAESRLSLADIVQVATDVADALTVAHAKGIIHRDIKPANVILVDKPAGAFGTKVLDFGLAKMDVGLSGGGAGGPVPKEAGMDLTSIGSTVGTVSYMSPEQARGELLDARSDLFSLGVVMYEMTTGQVPFSGATSALVFVQLLSHPPEAVRQLNGEIPRELERVINKLLEKDRSRRFQSASALVEALRRVPTTVAAGKSPWWSLGSLVRARPTVPPAPRAASDLSVTGKRVTLEQDPPPPPPARQPPVGESVLRPVKRIVSSDSSLRPAVPLKPILSALVAQGSGDTEITDPLPAGARGSGLSQPMTSSAGIRVPAAAAVGSAPEVPAVAAIAAVSSSAATDVATGSGAGVGAVAEPLPASSSSVRIPRPLPEMRWHYSLALKEEEEQQPAEANYGWVWIAALAAAFATVLVWYFWPRHHVIVNNEPRTVVLAGFTNSTGDSVLPGVVLAGLQFDLAQSRLLNVQDSADLAAGLRSLGAAPEGPPALADEQRAAQAIGAAVMVVGELKKFNSAYVITTRVYDVASGDRVAEVSETAPTREQIPITIDRVASGIRSSLGEAGESIARSSLPLDKEASSNLDALSAYVAGRQMVETGQLIAAMHAFETATTADPRFVQAYLPLAWLYRAQHAGTAAAGAATQAQKASQDTGSRTQGLVEAAYAINAGDDLPRAANALQTLLANNPADSEAAAELAGTLLEEGKFQEALEASQAILKSNPYDLEASRVAETALLAQDHAEAASQIESTLQRSGRSHPGLRVWANYLGTREDNQLTGDVGGQLGRLGLQQDEAAALDAAGLLESGLPIWRTVAAQASANPELMSAASEILASAALDRALAADCASAKELLTDSAGYPQTARALFGSGLTEALCGNLDAANRTADLLQQTYPHSFAVENLYRPDLLATIAWKHGDLAGALGTLDAAKDYDLVSLTPYLRGLVHLEARQSQDAIADFEVVLGHRGASTLVNPMLYPMAQLGEARAYAASGDDASSLAAYRKLVAFWGTADPNLLPVREARGRTGTPISQP